MARYLLLFRVRLVNHMLTAPITPLTPPVRSPGLTLVPVRCCLCGSDFAEPVAVGEDFEYHTSPDTFLAVRCCECSLIYLNPRPSLEDLPVIYPPSYHAFSFSAERFGLAHAARERLETQRLRSYCRDLPETARILDAGCGDGFHLRLLRRISKPGWSLEGVDASFEAVTAARQHGLEVHHGLLEKLQLPSGSYDLVLLIATVEHVSDPLGLLSHVSTLLRPGGRAIIVTDNARSIDFGLFRSRHWGGYHFPRHWNLFTRETLRRLTITAGLEVERCVTVCSPVNWVYSLRNLLVDWKAAPWLVEQFSLKSPVSLAVFTILDRLLQFCGRGALLKAVLRRPIAPAR